MKNINTKTKIIACIVAIIIIVGLIITFTFGLNFELKYQQSNKVQVLLGKEFEINDIRQITDEIFPGQEVIIQKAREFEDVVNITTKEITEDQKNNLVNKLNEKYQIELNAENTMIANNPHVRGRDIIKPYIVPFIIATVIILIYFAIRYYKLNISKTLLISIISIIIAQLVLLSVMAITRIPIGRFTISLVLIVYIL